VLPTVHRPVAAGPSTVPTPGRLARPPARVAPSRTTARSERPIRPGLIVAPPERTARVTPSRSTARSEHTARLGPGLIAAPPERTAGPGRTAVPSERTARLGSRAIAVPREGATRRTGGIRSPGGLGRGCAAGRVGATRMLAGRCRSG
jgi:hypothetical protein